MVAILLLSLFAQIEWVPERLQAAIFAKVLHYDLTLKALNGKFHIWVVTTNKSSTATKTIVKSFKDVGVSVSAVTLEELKPKNEKISVVYVTKGVPIEELSRFTEKNKVLSFSGISSQVEAGLISVGLELKGGTKAQIVVNLARLKIENHQLSAGLLNLARTIK